jgi:hypothetical protein
VGPTTQRWAARNKLWYSLERRSKIGELSPSFESRTWKTASLLRASTQFELFPPVLRLDLRQLVVFTDELLDVDRFGLSPFESLTIVTDDHVRLLVMAPV